MRDGGGIGGSGGGSSGNNIVKVVELLQDKLVQWTE